MKTSNQQISLFGETKSTSLQEVFLANPTAKQVSEKAKTMNAISGLSCLREFELYDRNGSWAKTFSGLLIGMKGWCSKRCRLTWKLKATKYNRLYFQLQVRALPTEEIESGLLPTPVVMDTNQGDLEKIDKRRAKIKEKGINGNGFGMTVGEMANRGMLPTPRVSDIEGAKIKEVKVSEEGNYYRENQKGERWGVKLRDVVENGLLPTPRVGGQEDYETRAKRKGHTVAMSYLESNIDFLHKNGMIPTPTARDVKGTNSMEHLTNSESGHANHVNQLPNFMKVHGMDGQLNPLFVGEMMGFPANWTLLPFLDGEEKALKPTETQ